MTITLLESSESTEWSAWLLSDYPVVYDALVLGQARDSSDEMLESYAAPTLQQVPTMNESQPLPFDSQILFRS